jgi:glycosyltransferase involved in cell wall biosynthesis
MRIVFVSPYPPSRLHPRAFGMVTTLAQRHDVTVVCLCHSPQEIAQVAPLRAAGIRVAPVFQEATHAVARSLGALMGEQPLQVAYDSAPLLRAAVMDEIAQGDVALVHVEHLRAAAALLDLPVPVLWDAVACESLLCRLGREHATLRSLRARNALEASRTRELERRLLRTFAHVLVSTERDRAALVGAEQPLALAAATPGAADPDAPSSPYVIPSGVDLDYFCVQPRRRHHNRLIFTGRMDTHAHIAAAEYLVRELMPRIWRQRPDVQLTIAGSAPPRRLRAFARDPRVIVTGHVEDLRPYLAGATIAVSPLTYGVGIQNGVLEALATGTPVVATEPAIGGLAAIPGRDLLVAGTPDRFAQLVIRLLDDEALWRSLAHSGRIYVERHHAWPLITQQLEGVYRAASGFNFTLASAGAPVPALLPAGYGW